MEIRERFKSCLFLINNMKEHISYYNRPDVENGIPYNIKKYIDNYYHYYYFDLDGKFDLDLYHY